VSDTQPQLKLPGVPEAKQGREVPARWAWTEASVWNERMLATLERGIKGGQGSSKMAQRLLRGTGADLPDHSPGESEPIL